MKDTEKDSRAAKLSVTRASERSGPADGLVLGRIVSVNGLGVPAVEFPGNPRGNPTEARTVVALDADHVGRTVALAFEGGRFDAPIVLGVLHDPLSGLIGVGSTMDMAREALVDGERVVIEAEREIVLRCGEASIKLQRDGRILISGTHLLSRSKGPNRIKGASVQLN